MPFQFDDDVPMPAAGPLERRGASKAQAIPAHHGLKRVSSGSAGSLSSSPPKKEAERQQGQHLRKPASPATSADGRKHRRDPSAKNLPQLAATASSARALPAKAAAQAAAASALKPRAVVRPVNSAASLTPVRVSTPPAPNPLSGSKFAGPAFTNSPTPDSLPIPTSSLLMAEALHTTLQL